MYLFFAIDSSLFLYLIIYTSPKYSNKNTVTDTRTS